MVSTIESHRKAYHRIHHLSSSHGKYTNTFCISIWKANHIFQPLSSSSHRGVDFRPQKHFLLGLLMFVFMLPFLFRSVSFFFFFISGGRILYGRQHHHALPFRFWKRFMNTISCQSSNKIYTRIQAIARAVFVFVDLENLPLNFLRIFFSFRYLSISVLYLFGSSSSYPLKTCVSLLIHSGFLLARWH